MGGTMKRGAEEANRESDAAAAQQQAKYIRKELVGIHNTLRQILAAIEKIGLGG